MKRLLKNPIFNIVLLIVIGVLVMFVSLQQDFEGIIESFKGANIQWLYFCIALILLYYYMGGYLLKLYANLFNPKFTTTQGFLSALIGAFGSGITPSASGGQFFQIVPFKKYGVKVSETASILWLDFIIYQTTMNVMVLVLFVWKFSDYFKTGGIIFYLVIAGFIINLMVMLVLLLLYKSNRFHFWITNKVVYFLHKIKLLKNPEEKVNSINIQIDHFHESSQILQKNRWLLLKAVLISSIRFVIYYSVPFFIILAINIDIDATKIIDVMALTSFVSMVNAFIPIPGASGGTELTFVDLFSGLLKNGVIPVMLVWRAITFYFVVILGGIVFYFVSRYESEEQA